MWKQIPLCLLFHKDFNVSKITIPLLSSWSWSLWGTVDVTSSVTSIALSAPSLSANISSRLLSSSEICSTFRFVSAWNRQEKEEDRGKQRTRETAQESSYQTFLDLNCTTDDLTCLITPIQQKYVEKSYTSIFYTPFLHYVLPQYSGPIKSNETTFSSNVASH